MLLSLCLTRRLRDPTFVNRSYPRSYVVLKRWSDLAVLDTFAEIDSVTSVWRPEISARGTPAREVRRLEDASIVTSFQAGRQVQKPAEG